MPPQIYFIGESKSEETQDAFTRIPGVELVTYSDLINGSDVIASEAPVFLGFPYSLWNIMVEKADLVYGNPKFWTSINELAWFITESLEKRFPDAMFVNHPMSILLERDKSTAKSMVEKQGIRVPRQLPLSIDRILEEIESGNKLYIKVRLGSMGKGITYLEKGQWITNFSYENGRIANQYGDLDWKKTDITGDLDCLKRILELDVIVEAAVQNPLVNGFKFDLRSPSIYGRVFKKFTYARISAGAAITNISQGAHGTSYPEIKKMIPEVKIKEAMEVIRKASCILGLNYAGVDILFEGKNFDPVFLELNSFPGIAFNGARVINELHQHIIQAAEESVPSYAASVYGQRP